MESRLDGAQAGGMPSSEGAASPVLDPASGSAEGRSAGPMAGALILVVDDHRDSADSLSRVLGLLGYQVQTAYDAQGALEAAGQSPPDVAIVDIGLPLLDGHELARRMRAQSWGDRIFLIALTGWAGEDRRREAMEAGFDHHFVKPVELEALVATMGRYRDGSRRRSGSVRAGADPPA